MASLKPSSRYSSLESRSSASSPSTSSEFKNPNKNHSSLKRIGKSPNSISAPGNSSRALVKAGSSDIAQVKVKNEQSLGSMVKKFMDKRSKIKAGEDHRMLVIPADIIAEDLKKTASKGSKFSAFPKKLFQKGSSPAGNRTETKALTEVKANTRTLAMVLRSERELLNQNKEYETEILELKMTVEEKNTEVEKLKDLCLKQREEIKSLKSAILFPDVMNSHLHEILEKQGSEFKHARQVIPTLQKQVTSLTGQLQSLAEGLAEVKADKYAAQACFEHPRNSPKTPAYDQEASNSLEYSSGDPVTPGSPDDLFIKDLNPCLTPYYATAKSKELEMMGYESPNEEPLEAWNDNYLGSLSHGGKLTKSSEYCTRPSLGSAAGCVARRSDENKCVNGNLIHQKLF